MFGKQAQGAVVRGWAVRRTAGSDVTLGLPGGGTLVTTPPPSILSDTDLSFPLLLGEGWRCPLDTAICVPPLLGRMGSVLSGTPPGHLLPLPFPSSTHRLLEACCDTCPAPASSLLGCEVTEHGARTLQFPDEPPRCPLWDLAHSWRSICLRYYDMKKGPRAGDLPAGARPGSHPRAAEPPKAAAAQGTLRAARAPPRRLVQT